MGINASKVPVETNASQKVEDLVSSDPRSPTPEISRTPLQTKGGAKRNITKNADLRKTFEATNEDEKLIHNNPILSAVIKNHLQTYDPRSPTQDFERTPIVLANKNNNENETNNFGSPCLKNDDSVTLNDEIKHEEYIAAKNLCEQFFDVTLEDSMKETEVPLGSSTASSDSIEKDVTNESQGTPKQFLETNFDYTEDKQVPIQVAEHPIINEIKRFNLDPRSPTIEIERTPIIISKAEDSSLEENVEGMSDDSLIKALQNANAELRQGKTEKKSGGVLIYEDESPKQYVTPKKARSIGTSGSRTPLSCMKNKGHSRSKSANDSTDSNISKRASHIPRLKALSKPTKLNTNLCLKDLNKVGVVSGDCENTPPTSHRGCWEEETSVVL